MKTRILLSKDFCRMEVVKYIASRYNTTPEKVLHHYFVQMGLVKNENSEVEDYTLQPNELALFSDLGVQPAEIELI